MRKLVIISIVLFVLASCKDKKTSGTTTEVDKTGTGAADPKKDSAEIRQQIMAFYYWYVKNEAKLREYPLYKNNNKKGEQPYKIDWVSVDSMHAYMRSNVPFLGEEFIKNQKSFFKEADSAFKYDEEGDIPYGFDHDWYTQSQEDPQYLLDELNKSGRWVITVNGDNAIADIKTMFNDNGTQVENTLIKLGIKRENGTWKIARIGVD